MEGHCEKGELGLLIRHLLLDILKELDEGPHDSLVPLHITKVNGLHEGLDDLGQLYVNVVETLLVD